MFVKDSVGTGFDFFISQKNELYIGKLLFKKEYLIDIIFLFINLEIFK
jgi:hypothetical protein